MPLLQKTKRAPVPVHTGPPLRGTALPYLTKPVPGDCGVHLYPHLGGISRGGYMYMYIYTCI